eukprot:Plantae.Rhodophyta-Purpureofilum_apyrenoidigerum.ctg1685.p1 GENE.Plantae.Rhodophyta-Purpureofilum_apyrenoidigerum.ctg1685~~Plantae.Rhodophyta-Purpureofilum_apyrenoidigerum.ctg1685.p1  ORF type:complete len:339 (-),score=49.55 Plantae.Rhodophyta-Purpureofilum_apyrenoidigerum.ctg1685:774-1691(-)
MRTTGAFVPMLARGRSVREQWMRTATRRTAVRMGAREKCPSAAVLQSLINQRKFRMNASSFHIKNPDVDEGSDSTFVLVDEGFVGVTDTGVVDAAELYGDVLARVVRFENRTILDNIVGKILCGRPENRWTSVARYLENALSHVSFPQSASTCVLSLEDQKVRAAWVGSAGFVVIRNEETVFRSFPDALTQLEHSFQSEIGSAVQKPPRPQEVVFDVEEDDLIIVATDGFWHNVSETQMHAFLRPTLPPGMIRGGDDPQQQSVLLAHLGFNYADMEEQDNFLSDQFVPGASRDDVSVIVVSITRE